MTPVEQLRKQHEQILAVAGQIQVDDDKAIDESTAERMVQGIHHLKELLEEHLLLEDDFLYPALSKRTDQTARDTANLFSIQFGGIRSAFNAYSGKWSSPSAILQEPELFTSKTKALMAVLNLRVKNEEAELLPLLNP